MSLNHSKTSFIFFSKSNLSINLDLLPISIYNIPITRVYSTKFLGVIIDYKLSWSDHISSLTKITSRNIGVMSKLRLFLPPFSIVLLYNTLILPYLKPQSHSRLFARKPLPDCSRLVTIGHYSKIVSSFLFFMCSFGKLWECPVQSSAVLCGREHVPNLKNPPRFFLAA